MCKNALQNLKFSFAATVEISSACGRTFFLDGPHEHPARLMPSVIRAFLHDESVRCTHGNQMRAYLFIEDAR